MKPESVVEIREAICDTLEIDDNSLRAKLMKISTLTGGLIHHEMWRKWEAGTQKMSGSSVCFIALLDVVNRYDGASEILREFGCEMEKTQGK